jgi:N-acetylneuraminate synthase/N,N'-diacetyllegionaminate synthase
MIKVGRRVIGDGNPIFIMADVGVTNGGDFERSKKLIEAAAAAGADAIKFQFIGRDDLLGEDRTTKATFTCHDGEVVERTLHDLFEPFDYSESEWKELCDFSKSLGLEFICTSHVLAAVPILDRVGVDIHKICAWSSDHKRLIQALGRSGKPLMLDTGNYTTTTLAQTLDWHSTSGGRGAVLLHDFHTSKPEEMNFNAIPYMRKQFGFPVGYTPQETNDRLDYMSIGLGASVLERRLTLDVTIRELGHAKAYEPDQFTEWVTSVRRAEQALGFEAVIPPPANLEATKGFYKSLFVNRDLIEGEVLTDCMLSSHRPGTGILAGRVDEIIGRRINKSLSKHHMLSIDDIN